jgi:hypothetical protein
MDRNAGLPVDIEHLAVLRTGCREVEAQANPLGSLRHGIARLPGEVLNRPDQYVPQATVFAIDTPR